MPSASVTWRDVCFVHWRVDPATVAGHLPPGLSVATRDGDAWVGAVPFRMTGPRIRREGTTRVRRGKTTSSGIGSSSGGFAELNFRTYVTRDDRRGVYFFSLDAADPLVVALSRRLFGLPFYRAEARFVPSGDCHRFFARRTDDRGPPARFVAAWRPADGTVARPPSPGSLEAFLVGRRGYFVRRGGRLHYGTVARGDFRVRPAAVDVASNSLFRAAGLPDPADDPVGLVAEGETAVEVRGIDPVEGG